MSQPPLSAIDLHTHSTASDGTLSPSALVAHAHAAGVRTLALTDHDCTDGIAEAQHRAAALGMRLVPGTEISVRWERRTLHVLALNPDIDDPTLRAGLDQQAASRDARARAIGHRLDKLGIAGAYEGARSLAAESMITRAHFARHLVAAGHCPDMNSAFKRWLGNGKRANVSADWAPLEDVLDWIGAAGGIAVLAHPTTYGLTGARMRRLLDAFSQTGGAAMEVVCGNAHPSVVETLAGYARRFGLAASVGSDFHTPDNPWVQPGRLRALPSGLQPVWELDAFAPA
ncbi:MAG: PHP domain-containing protein [Pseudomonadota bacterium]